ncbi:BTAD domain-containing putative transcriptional regulator [Amycolatopsis coloradensis]|uniref:BTAD domain-containing putative transcriptional regulator n=1 Tax=Amycolatopsis coloradensis TaxID=76021 RepID=A0ACD5BPT2_9PSEU
MLFRVLGSLELSGQVEGPVCVRPRKPRTLLALLLLHAERWVSTPLIENALWEGLPPRSASGNVKTYVSQLRRTLAALGGDPSRIANRVGAYRISVKPSELDVFRFEESVRLGREARNRSADGEAVEHFREALGLWRGEPYEDLPLSIRRPVVARLEELRWTAREELIDVRLMLGQHHTVVPDLRALTIEHPTRERLWCLLLLALHRSGRRADALDAYQSAYRSLTDELGIEPGAELRRLHERMLADTL